MPAYKPAAVLLHVALVTHHQGALTIRYKAQWHDRQTGSRLYESKVCDTEAQAVTLARKWLEKANARPSRMGNILAAEAWKGPRYVDTTPSPERFGLARSTRPA